MPVRLISPGKPCSWMAKSTAWSGAFENPTCTACPHLSGVGRVPDGIWPPHYPPKNCNSFPDGHKIRSTLAASLLPRCIFWTHYSSLLVLPVKINMKKESVAPNQESSHVLAILLTDDTFFNTLIKSYHLLKINISTIIPHSFCFSFLSCP